MNVVKCNPSHPLGHVRTGMCPKYELLAHILPALAKLQPDNNSFQTLLALQHREDSPFTYHDRPSALHSMPKLSVDTRWWLDF